MQVAPLAWGILSTAQIGVNRVIPAIQGSELGWVSAIASRDLDRAEDAADKLGIPVAYGNYDELLTDSALDAIYIPLPNHMHVSWAIKAAEAGKHVLCEKPLGVTIDEVEQLIDVRDRTGVLIQEAFMVRNHPQWLRARDLVRDGDIGELRAIQAAFCSFRVDPNDIRNKYEVGGGALFDFGSYPIALSRMLFEEEPLRVAAVLDRDPSFKIDRLASAILDFPSGIASFTVSMQASWTQRFHIIGTTASIELETPYATAPDHPCRLLIDDGSQWPRKNFAVETFDILNHYTLQADRFAAAVGSGLPLEFPLEDSLKNMRVIEAVFRAAEAGVWADV